MKMSNDEAPKSLPIEMFRRDFNDVGDFYLNKIFSDFKFIVKGEIIYSHKIILATGSEYLKTLLLENTDEKEIMINDVDPYVFRTVLKYIYKGTFDVDFSNGDLLLQVLQLAHKYVIKTLEKKIIELVPSILNLSNVKVFLNYASLMDLNELRSICLQFIDRNILKMLEYDDMLGFTQKSMVNILQRDTLGISELKIFSLVRNWCRHNNDRNDLLKKCVRLNNLSIQELTDIVQPTKLFEDKILLDVISQMSRKGFKILNPRASKVVDVNIANNKNGAKIISGDRDTSTSYFFPLLNPNRTNSVYHDVGDKRGITVDLGRISCFNNIQFEITTLSGYYIELSKDNKEWDKVTDYTNFKCSSLQNLYYNDEQLARYVRLVGTDEVKFEIKQLQVLLKESIPDVVNQIVKPTQNVATQEMGAGICLVLEAVEVGKSLQFKSNWDIPPHRYVTISLAQPFLLTKIEFSVKRGARYLIQTSVDFYNWETVADRIKVDCTGLQTYEIYKVAMFIQIKNTTDKDLECSNFKCY